MSLSWAPSLARNKHTWKATDGSPILQSNFTEYHGLMPFPKSKHFGIFLYHMGSILRFVSTPNKLLYGWYKHFDTPRGFLIRFRNVICFDDSVEDHLVCCWFSDALFPLIFLAPFPCYSGCLAHLVISRARTVTHKTKWWFFLCYTAASTGREVALFPGMIQWRLWGLEGPRSAPNWKASFGGKTGSYDLRSCWQAHFCSNSEQTTVPQRGTFLEDRKLQKIY